MTERKYPVGGFAPGNYYCHCTSCGVRFRGDKRALQCEPCGIKSEEWFNSLTDEEKAEHTRKALEEYKKIFNQ
jgi:predicted  nucleic acid-binding Zn-ribbon protein